MPVLYAAVTWSITMVIVGFSTSYPLTMAVMFVMGTCIPPWVTSMTTILQTHTDRPMLGRVMALYSMCAQISFLGWLLGGWLGQLIGNDWMLTVTGGAFVVVHLIIFLTSREMQQV